MAKRSNNFVIRLFIDIGGVILIVLSALVGWMPGPLGIPLLIAGLGLLSINHVWAERWLERVRSGGVKIMDKIFSNNIVIKRMLDALCLTMLVAAWYILSHYHHRILLSLAIALAAFSLFLFFGNRRRLSRLLRFAKVKR